MAATVLAARERKEPKKIDARLVFLVISCGKICKNSGRTLTLERIL
jgi:hypothetical protein